MESSETEAPKRIRGSTGTARTYCCVAAKPIWNAGTSVRTGLGPGTFGTKMQPTMSLRHALELAGITVGPLVLVGAAWVLVLGPLLGPVVDAEPARLVRRRDCT